MRLPQIGELFAGSLAGLRRHHFVGEGQLTGRRPCPPPPNALDAGADLIRTRLIGSQVEPGFSRCVRRPYVDGDIEAGADAEQRLSQLSLRPGAMAVVVRATSQASSCPRWQSHSTELLVTFW